MSHQEIFDHMADLVTRSEFNEAQTEFYTANCTKFEDTEEQKHEYKQIYEEFLHIIDQTIDAKLKEEFGHSDEELDGFYQGFKDNFEKFRAQNSDVVETLFEVLDFEKFRKGMIDFQKGMKDNTDNNVNSLEFMGNADAEADFTAVFKEKLADKATGWKRKLQKKMKKDGYSLEVHQRKQANYGVDLIRSDAILQGLTEEAVVNFWVDPPAEKMSMVKEARLIEETPEFAIWYWRMKLPLMSDRELVFKQSHKKYGNGTLFSLHTIDREDVPPTKGVVRMTMKVHAFVRPSEANPADIEYTEITVMDLKGSMPTRLLNMTIASESQKGIKEMYQLLKSKA